MLLGRVVGTLVATRKEPSMSALKFLVLKQLDIEGKETGGYRVAADAVGAGLGEVVLYATGSAARQTKITLCAFLLFLSRLRLRLLRVPRCNQP